MDFLLRKIITSYVEKKQGNSIYFINEFYLLERSRRKTNMKFVSQ